MVELIARVSKAVTAAAAAGSSAAAAALIGDQAITASEWLTVAVAIGAGFLATWAAPANRPPAAG
jgi:hypothetical protein